MGDSAKSPLATNRRRWRRRFVGLVGLGLVALVAVEAGRAVIPPRALRGGPLTVEIPPQQGLLGVAGVLAEAQVIRSRVAFVALAVLRGTARSLKAGEYEIP